MSSSSRDDEILDMEILELLDSSSDDGNQEMARIPQRNAQYAIWIINGHSHKYAICCMSMLQHSDH